MARGHPDWLPAPAENITTVPGLTSVLGAVGSETVLDFPPTGQRYRVLAWQIGISAAMLAHATLYTELVFTVQWSDSVDLIVRDIVDLVLAERAAGVAHGALAPGWVHVPGSGIVLPVDSALRLVHTCTDAGANAPQDVLSRTTSAFLVVEETP